MTPLPTGFPFLLWPGLVLTLAAGLLLAWRRCVELRTRADVLAREGEALSTAASDLDAVLGGAPCAIVVCDPSDGAILYGNEQASAYGASPSGAGGTIFEALPAMNREDFRALVTDGDAAGVRRVELLARSASHTELDLWLTVTSRPIVYRGRPGSVLCLIDISDLKRAQSEIEMLSAQRALVLDHVQARHQEMREASVKDELTGLYNRRYFASVATREFARCRRARQPVGLLVVDVDHFKQINDRFGHPVGDQVLRALAQVLLSSFRSEDVVCRVGGEEFIVLMPGTDAGSCFGRAERLREKVAGTQILAGVEGIGLTVSVGVAVADVEAETPEQLVARADEAVYRAKAGGRNRVVMAVPRR